MVLSIMDSARGRPISNKDLQLKRDLENRFGFEGDSCNDLLLKSTVISPLLVIYQGYWRTGLLHPQQNF
jgi:hypothetical protein